MAKWRGKDVDNLEKIGKIRKKSFKKTHAADLTEAFEKTEDSWNLSEGAFAARVVEVHKRYAFVSPEPEVYQVDTRDVWLAEVARKFLVAERSERNFVAVGDRVLCTPDRDQVIKEKSDLPKCVIQQLAPRTTLLKRLDPQVPGRYHVLATNMDQVLIVASYLGPKIKWGLIDRYLVLSESEGIRPIIVLNKQDLLEDEGSEEFKAECDEMIGIYRKIGYTVLSFTASAAGVKRTNVFKELKALLQDKVTLLSGHSGVGKSSLVNLFKPEIEQAVEENDDIFYKGRHTTSFASFIKLGSGGYVIDTPGIRSFTFDEMGAINLSHCFVEIRPYLGKCKYRECRHIDEPDCAVRKKVEEGEISTWRYKSYLSILLGASGREGRLRDIDFDEE